MVAPTDLTRPVTIPTNVPAPARDLELKWAASDNESPTLEIVTCSEFVEYAAPVQHFGSKHKFKAIQGFQPEPTLFAIGDSGELTCLLHEVGVSGGWTLHSISPFSAKVVHFDAIDIDDAKIAKPGIYLAASTSDGNNALKLYTAFLASSDLKQEGEGGPETSIWKNVPWIETPDPKGPKSITSLLFGPVKNRAAGYSPLVLFVGTQSHEAKAATFYAVDLTPDLSDPWTSFSPATGANIVVDIQPASPKGEDGVFVLTRSGAQQFTECLFYGINPTGLELVSEGVKRALSGNLGKIQAMSTSRTWLGTDLILACENGVGFVNGRDILTPALKVKGLPSISFSDVVCSEDRNPAKPSETYISIYAISSAGELYFIQGSRKWSTNGSIELWSSGLPIRTNVSRITCRYNKKLRSSQLVYTKDGSNTLMHLLRDPDTGCWSDAAISFEAPQEVTRYNAFVSTISIRDTLGRSIGKGFPINIASESISVLVNERSYTLSEQVTRVTTNDQGQIVLVAAAMASIKAPKYMIHIANGGVNHLATIEAGQRLVRLLSEVNSKEAVINAKSTTGELIFDKKAFEGKNQQLQESVELLQQFPTMVDKVSTSNSSETNFIQLASDDRDGGFLDVIGDVLEWIRNKAKEAVKLVVTPLMRGIKIALTFLDKVIDVVIDTVGPLLDLIGTVLKNNLGFDFNDLFRWLGLTFDNEKTKKNQMILQGCITTALSLPGEITRGTKKDLEAMFDRVEASLEPLLGYRKPISIPDQGDPRTALRKSPLAWLFDSPIINMIMRFNPVSVIIEALSESLTEELSDFIQMPDIFEHFRAAFSTLGNVAQKEFDVFWDLLTRFWERIKDFASDPSRILELLKEGFQDFFHTIFDAVKTLITGLWEAIGQFMDGLLSFFKAEWKIPIISRLFEWYAGQDFTLLNLFTFAVTRIMGLVVGEDQLEYLFNFREPLEAMMSITKQGGVFSAAVMEQPESFGNSFKDLGLTGADARVSNPFPINMLQTDLAFSASDTYTKHLPAGPPPPPAARTANTAYLPPKNKTSAWHDSDHGNHHLSKEAKHRIHKFETWAKGISAVVGGFRFLTVCMETQQLLAGGESHGVAPLVCMLVSTSVTGLGSFCHMGNWLSAREHSAEVKQHLDESFNSIVTGTALSMFFNVSAIGLSATAVWRAKHHSPTQVCSFAATVCTTVGTYSETIAIHIIPGWDEKNAGSTTIKAAQWIELVASGVGFASCCCAPFPLTKPAAPLLSVGDGILSLLSVILTVISATAPFEDDEKEKQS
ncbi:hypothetical protein NM208_g6908 [Fusarium decemcellulare]|uniref:Uncharacterized protein n=1 Tax=Fusarium decemcellulare TaxID=57161 RepID=A0ACC1SBI7_9HYPO|nr:hypothetical protein NM208_g6908 [Fusarium decemcellulare]